MADIQLIVQSRDTVGKSQNRKIRKTGLIPAIIYGKGKENVSLLIQPELLKKALITGGGINTLIHLEIQNGKSAVKKMALVKEIQRDLLKKTYRHVDFYEIDLTKKIVVEVPIHFTGKAEGAKEGGILQQTIREVRVKCFPNKIPSHIEVDISHLKVGDSLHIADIKTTENYEIVYDHNEAIASLNVPKEEVVEAAAPKEGEVIVTEGAPAVDTKAETPKKEEAPKKEEKK